MLHTDACWYTWFTLGEWFCTCVIKLKRMMFKKYIIIYQMTHWSLCYFFLMCLIEQYLPLKSFFVVMCWHFKVKNLFVFLSHFRSSWHGELMSLLLLWHHYCLLFWNICSRKENLSNHMLCCILQEPGLSPGKNSTTLRRCQIFCQLLFLGCSLCG